MSIVSNGSVVAAPSSKAERTTTVVDENAGLEEIPPCSFSNLTAIMTRSMENAFYRSRSIRILEVFQCFDPEIGARFPIFTIMNIFRKFTCVTLNC